MFMECLIFFENVKNYIELPIMILINCLIFSNFLGDCLEKKDKY